MKEVAFEWSIADGACGNEGEHLGRGDSSGQEVVVGKRAYTGNSEQVNSGGVNAA